MYLNGLPPEILLHILSYVPQKDIVSGIQYTSSYFKDLSLSPELWSRIDFSTSYEGITDPLNHFYQVQEFVNYLVIKGENLTEVFTCSRQIRLQNVSSLEIRTSLTYDLQEFLTSKRFVKMFPSIESFSFSWSTEVDIKTFPFVFTKLNLKSLSFRYRYIDNDVLISVIKSQTNLQELCLKINNLKECTISKIINEYPHFTTVKLNCKLEISDNVFTSSLSPLALTTFSITSSHFTDTGLESLLRRASCLVNLEIKYCRITNQGLQNLNIYGGLLQTLAISFTTNDQDCHLCTCNQTLQLISSGCPRLQCFTALSCKHIDSSGFSALVKSCKYLTELELWHCRIITDEIFLSLRNSTMLKLLKLVYGDINVSLSSVITLLKSSKRLVDCVLYCIHFRGDVAIHPSNIAEASVATEINSSDINSGNSHSHLKSLSIIYGEVTTESILRLVKACTDLTHLRIYCTIHIEKMDTFMSELFDNCVSLRTVILNCANFNRSDVLQDNR